MRPSRGRCLIGTMVDIAVLVRLAEACTSQPMVAGHGMRFDLTHELGMNVLCAISGLKRFSFVQTLTS